MSDPALTAILLGLPAAGYVVYQQMRIEGLEYRLSRAESGENSEGSVDG